MAGTDGALYLSDMYNNTSARTFHVSGTIYRISHKDEGKVTRPRLDYTTTVGLIEALKSPASSVRATAVPRLAAKGDAIVAQLMKLFGDKTNPFVQARAIWVLAQTGPKGQSNARKLLANKNPQWRLVAYRALRWAKPDELLEHARALARDQDPSVRREVALSMRNVPYEQCKEVLRGLIEGYDGENRWYLEALGTAATGKETEVYAKLIRPQLIKIPFSKWNDRAKHLAWRFHTPEAINDLSQVIMAQKPQLELDQLETEKALVELNKANDDDAVFKHAGTILIKSNKKDLIEELEEKKELAKTKSSLLAKQEERLKTSLKEQEIKIQEMIKKPSSTGTQ